MSDLDKELNFDDITGKKIEKVESLGRFRSEPQKTGTEILVPVGKNEWVSKDLIDVTGEEFAAWAKGVFPVPLNKKDIELLDKSLEVKVQSFKNIMKYHMNSLFHLGRTGKRNTTEH